jgi:hypothetical protein
MLMPALKWLPLRLNHILDKMALTSSRSSTPDG